MRGKPPTLAIELHVYKVYVWRRERRVYFRSGSVNERKKVQGAISRRAGACS